MTPPWASLLVPLPLAFTISKIRTMPAGLPHYTFVRLKWETVLKSSLQTIKYFTCVMYQEVLGRQGLRKQLTWVTVEGRSDSETSGSDRCSLTSTSQLGHIKEKKKKRINARTTHCRCFTSLQVPASPLSHKVPEPRLISKTGRGLVEKAWPRQI